MFLRRKYFKYVWAAGAGKSASWPEATGQEGTRDTYAVVDVVACYRMNARNREKSVATEISCLLVRKILSKHVIIFYAKLFVIYYRKIIVIFIELFHEFSTCKLLGNY